MPLKELHIDFVGPMGDGVSRSETAPPLFIERTLPQEQVRVRILPSKKGVHRAELVEILTASPFRQSPPCKHYDVCGACTFQHAHETFYREWKIDLVKRALQKQKVRFGEWKAPLFISPGSRRRATFAATVKKGKVSLGYFQRRSHQVTAIEECLIASPRLLELRNEMEKQLARVLTPNEPTDVFLQLFENQADLLITSSVPHHRSGEKRVKEWARSLVAKTGIGRVSWRNYERGKISVLASQSELTIRFGPLAVNLPPGAFLQPTLEGEQAMAEAVTQSIEDKKLIADLFSGCGTFSGPLLKRAKGVEAYEWDLAAVKALSQAKKKHSLNVFRRNLFTHPLKRRELNRYDAIVFDPPRSGCEEQARELAKANVPVLVGISCNPATFARDASHLLKGGYRLESVQMIDQFVWSHHIELVGVFRR